MPNSKLQTLRSQDFLDALRPRKTLVLKNLANFHSAYSLIEILVSISIIVILFLVGFAGYREFSRRQQLVATVRQVREDIRLTQELAIASKKPAGCSVLDGYYFVVIPANTYQIQSVCGVVTTVEKAVTLPSGFTISGLSPNLTPSNSILFKTLGQGTNIPTAPGSTNITLTHTDYGSVTTVTVTAGGEIR
jgi:type II secretory pathway pseudopilin PulG